MARNRFHLSAVALSVGLAFAAQAHAELRGQREATDRLMAETGGNAKVSIHEGTGSARFVRVDSGRKLGAPGRARALSDSAKHVESDQFLSQYSSLFGITDVASELAAPKVDKDRYGGTHITRKQVYKGVPVYGAQLRTHFDGNNNLTAVSGAFVPGISVDPKPGRSAQEASKAAVARVRADLGREMPLSTTEPALVVYQTGLAQGVEGQSHLAWQVEVGNRVNVREIVFVDAHTGKIIEKFNGIHEALNRRAFDGVNATAPGPNYPNNPFWVEGSALPTGVTEADNMLNASADIYNLFKVAFGRDSFDGNGARMDSIFNRGNACPNASWNGTFISFCPGLTTDDVTAHEWAHAYTEYTHGLIYAWQPGALNEAYSDIWGETVDRLNGRGGDTPDSARTAGSCTAFTAAPPVVTITAPAAIAGGKDAGTAAFGLQTFSTSGNVVGVEIGSTSAACAALPANSLTGKIAFLERGTCGFSVKAANAEAAGAIAVIVGNNQGGTALINMGATAGTVNTVPSLSVSQNDGTAIKAQLANGVSATLSRGPGTDNSVRWLLGEDSTATGLVGALRDMYNPTCYGNPGKVSDRQYSCGPNTQAGDNGGVHSNSGVPNHAYALIVDGGSYNGQSITGIGLTKAAHIYYRAQTVYQGPFSDFAAHADAIEQSCRDLTGANLADLRTGLPSGEVISAVDCAQVAKTTLAVEMRTPPSQCNFAPLLAKSPPPQCPAGTPTLIASDSFEGGKRGGIKWLVGHVGNSGDFTARDFGVVTRLPGSRPGYAIFAGDPNIGTCAPGGNEAGLQRLESPQITIPATASNLRMSFDHYIATEAGWDGGNLKISVNGGAWLVVRAADFIYNPYNATLTTAAQGSDSPLAGQPGFTGSDGGSLTGSWGRSIINLVPYAVPGDRIKLRFEFGNDGCGGVLGWYLDDVSVYQCTP